MKMAEFPALIQQTAEDPKIRVVVIAPDEIRRLPSAEAKKRLSALAHQVRVRPELVVYHVGTFGSYVEPLSRRQLMGHNIVVEINLPYTLHVPAGMAFQVRCPQVNGTATIQLRKTWTNRANGSNDAEVYADDQPLYYGPASLESPHLPQDPALGPWPHFTGTNLEIRRDTQGVFRYSQVRVFLDGSYPDIDGPDEDENVKDARATAVDEATRTATQIINYFIDVYRSVTMESHVERLPRLLVTQVYFADSNLFFEGVGIEAGLGSAIVNRSQREIREIAAMAEEGREPARHDLLMHSARSALERGQRVLAIVVAFQAQEIFIETKLRHDFSTQELKDAEISDRLKTHYRTKDRLTKLSREVTGGKSVADDGEFWNMWLTDCNGSRNGVVHRGDEITQAEAERVVELCEECISRFAEL